MLKSTSVSPGAVTKNGRCVVAAGLGEAVKGTLLPVSGDNLELGSISPHDDAKGFDLDQSGPDVTRFNSVRRLQRGISSGLI